MSHRKKQPSTTQSTMRSTKTPLVKVSSDEVDHFLEAVNNAPQVVTSSKGRLIFAIDATASRQPTWDKACRLQAEMFTQTKGLGGLDIQLCFYRGYDEFRVSPWHDNGDRLLKAMLTVQCQGGHTQIGKVLTHAVDEHQRHPIQAIVFIGDCIEENIDDLCQTAGQLGLLDVPVFLFQEGNDITALRGFKQIAKLSHGAHCHFDMDSAHQLSELLNAVAIYASGGPKALAQYSQGSEIVRRLTYQLEKKSV